MFLKLNDWELEPRDSKTTSFPFHLLLFTHHYQTTWEEDKERAGNGQGHLCRCGCFLRCDKRKMDVDNGQRRHIGARSVTDCIKMLSNEKRREYAKEHTQWPLVYSAGGKREKESERKERGSEKRIPFALPMDPMFEQCLWTFNFTRTIIT